MSQYNTSGCVTVTLTETVAKHERVAADGSQAGLERSLGTASQRGVSGDPITVYADSKPGTRKMIAAGAISAGANVYGAASGQVSATQGTGAFLEGIALEAASAAGDVIEVIPATGETAGS